MSENSTLPDSDKGLGPVRRPSRIGASGLRDKPTGTYLWNHLNSGAFSDYNHLQLLGCIRSDTWVQPERDRETNMTHLRIAAFVTAVGVALGAPGAAHATFIIDLSCGESKCAGGTDFFNDSANKDVSTFTGTVGGHTGTAVTVTTTGNIDTGAGFSTIKPIKGGTLTDLIFTPADDTLFTDFSFRGQLNPVGDTGVIDVKWTDSSGTSGTLVFTGVPGPDKDFDRLGIVSTDETLKSVEISTAAGESFDEFKQVQFSAASIPPSIPEASTWAMMILGFVGLGYASFRRTSKPRLA
jgi:hypothetical protein